MKYVIELEKIEGTNLYKAKGFNTLVFDEIGIGKLEPLVEVIPVERGAFKPGDIFKTINGKTVYEFVSYCNKNEHINAIRVDNNMFMCLPNTTKYVRVVE